ncbi:lysophospholipase [Mucilaginibacter hurinus]|uniref:Lysophospholipase n=1 Tax=Mucilaginibacter hurinus TaxID=2201324 RepID=A0A367GKQ9_9SPHI|nr:SGNH/GDSL hydrolase family protein [Mucilaginibacter hurinus]RCH54062.1 lysophospholipase [Mucilaginibacter hurinus]
MTTRRNFIKKAAIGSAAAISIPAIVNAVFASEKSKKVALKKDDIILFHGDSITDSGRDWGKHEFNTIPGLGNGYVLLSAAKLLNKHADKKLTIYNKGISGFKTNQLLTKWNDDFLAIKPTVISIMIGVNDYWHTKITSINYKGTLDDYRNNYRKLLTDIKKDLPAARLILAEPFGLKGVKHVDDTWYPALDNFRNVSKELATEFGAVFIPYQAVFNEALKVAPGDYWTTDGVHPTIAGTSLMSEAWLKAIE